MVGRRVGCTVRTAAAGIVGWRVGDRHDSGVRGTGRPPRAPGQHPRARHLRHPAGTGGGRVRRRGGLVGAGRPPGALRVPRGGRDAHRAQVATAVAGERRARTRRGADRLGRARPPPRATSRVPGLRGRSRRLRAPHRAGGACGSPHRRSAGRSGGRSPPTSSKG